MIRKAFVMQVNPDRHEEYRQMHNPIWPELEEVLKLHGVHNYSIFLHAETSQLFAYAEIDDDATWRSIAETDVCRRWWRHLKGVMQTNQDDSPASVDLQEVFHID